MEWRISWIARLVELPIHGIEITFPMGFEKLAVLDQFEEQLRHEDKVGWLRQERHPSKLIRDQVQVTPGGVEQKLDVSAEKLPGETEGDPAPQSNIENRCIGRAILDAFESVGTRLKGPTTSNPVLAMDALRSRT